MRSKRRISMFSWMWTALVVAVLFAVAPGCEEEDPAGASTTAVTLSAAKISVDDQSLDGQAIHPDETDGPVRYEARLVDRHGEPVEGYRVRVQVQSPGMMGSMHHPMQEFYCYDDGTHGDPVPGDGIYCYVDAGQEYGCHRTDAIPGEYHYDFCGVDVHGHESNHMGLKVNRLP